MKQKKNMQNKKQNKTQNIKYANKQTKNIEFKNTHALAHYQNNNEQVHSCALAH